MKDIIDRSPQQIEKHPQPPTEKEPFKFKASDFHNIQMRTGRPFWEYVADRANEILKKSE